MACLPALRQLLTIRKKQNSSHGSEPLCNRNSSTRPPLDSFSRLSDNHGFRLPNHIEDDDDDDEDSSVETSCRRPTPQKMRSCDNEKQSRHDGTMISSNKRTSDIRVSIASQPLWADRKVSSAETVEMSRVSPSTTFVQRKPSTGTIRPSTELSSPSSPPLPLPPSSWGGHRKSSSTDSHYYKNTTTNPSTTPTRRSIASPPLSPLRRPSSLSSSLPSTPNMQMQQQQQQQQQQHRQLSRFRERLSRGAMPEELLTLANPAAVGYSCEIHGGPSRSCRSHHGGPSMMILTPSPSCPSPR